jgi:G:T/U-mismatch repair DNA glycosylase
MTARLPENINEKKKFLLDNNIAVWDVLHSCEISGADDNSIKNPVVNDFTQILAGTKIKTVFT